jgi:hypothetical protein
VKTYNHICGARLVLLNESGNGQPVSSDTSFDYAQIGDLCPICGELITMELLQPLAIRINVDDAMVRAREAKHGSEAWAEDMLANSQATYWTLQSDGQLSIYNHDPAVGGWLLAVLSSEATQHLRAFLADNGPAL